MSGVSRAAVCAVRPCELLIPFLQLLPAPFSQGLFYFVTRQAAAHQQPPAADPFLRCAGQWHVKQCERTFKMQDVLLVCAVAAMCIQLHLE